MSDIKHQMIDALRTKYEGDYKIAHSTLNIYMDKLVASMTDAQDKLDILDAEYPPEMEKELLI